jgi:hypothetical protein
LGFFTYIEARTLVLGAGLTCFLAGFFFILVLTTEIVEAGVTGIANKKAKRADSVVMVGEEPAVYQRGVC